MKTVKFTSDLIPLILSGEKTSTWRLFDDKNLQEGDVISLQEFGKDEPFAHAVINRVKQLSFGELTADDMDGHEYYSSSKEMYKIFSGYYKTEVGPDTELKIIYFQVK